MGSNAGPLQLLPEVNQYVGVLTRCSSSATQTSALQIVEATDKPLSQAPWQEQTVLVQSNATSYVAVIRLTSHENVKPN
jgi:hypothetical protein